MADELTVEDGVAIGAVNSPEPANETDKIVYSDEERADYARFGETPAPEPTLVSPVKEEEPKVEEEPKGEPKVEKPSVPPTTPTTPTTPATPTPKG